MPTDYRWPHVVDFWFTIVTTLVFASLERAFEFVLYDWFYSICKEKDDLEARDRRTRKAVQNIYKTCYYASVTFFGWYTLRES